EPGVPDRPWVAVEMRAAARRPVAAARGRGDGGAQGAGPGHGREGAMCRVTERGDEPRAAKAKELAALRAELAALTERCGAAELPPPRPLPVASGRWPRRGLVLGLLAAATGVVERLRHPDRADAGDGGPSGGAGGWRACRPRRHGRPPA